MNEIQELEELLRTILSGLQEVLQSGEFLSDEFQGAVAETLNNLTSRIDQLRGEIPPEEPQAPPTNPPSSDAQLLWILAGQQEQAFISYLRTFPTPGTANLLNNPALLSQTIEQLTRLFPPGEQPIINGIPHADLNSSNVWGANYDQKSGKLKVRFQGGSEYEYDGVPANIFRAFIHGNANARTKGENQYGRWWPNKNPSLGAALNQYIKAGNYPYRRIR